MYMINAKKIIPIFYAKCQMVNELKTLTMILKEIHYKASVPETHLE